MSVDDPTEDRECPLCLEKLEIDDINFFPCTCKYQVCRFCWHRIRTDENGLCPACRKPYPEDPVNFQPITPMEMQQFKTERKQKEKKRNISECRKYLSAYRVLQRNLVYVVGLSSRIADPDILRRPDYFGKYGKVVKVAVGTLPSNTGSTPVNTAYVTFSKVEEALRTIQETNSLVFDGRMIKTSLGTTKYCSNFLRGQPCHKQECMYLHEIAPPELSFTKDDMHQGKHTEYERKLLEKLLASDAANGRSDHTSDSSAGYSLVIDTIGATSTAHLQYERPASVLGPDMPPEKVESPYASRAPSLPPERKPSITAPSAAVTVRAPAPAAVVEPEPLITRRESEQRPVENVTVLDPVFPPTPTKPAKPAVVERPRCETPPRYVAPRFTDDLGFDPFAESMKGLQELIAESESDKNSATQEPTSYSRTDHYYGYNNPLDNFPDSNFTRDLMSSSMNNYNGARMANNNPFGGSNMLSNYHNYGAQPSSHLYSQQPNHLEKQYNSGLGAFNFLMGGGSNGSSLTNNSRSNAPDIQGFPGYPSRHDIGSSYNPNSANNGGQQDSREMFKSLLPNVNVQFVSSNDTRGLFNSASGNHFPPPGLTNGIGSNGMGSSTLTNNSMGSSSMLSNGTGSNGIGGGLGSQYNRASSNYRGIDMSMFNHNGAARPPMFDSHPPGLQKWMTSPPPGFDSARPGS